MQGEQIFHLFYIIDAASQWCTRISITSYYKCFLVCHFRLTSSNTLRNRNGLGKSVTISVVNKVNLD
jgi:hypothetical protein